MVVWECCRLSTSIGGKPFGLEPDAGWDSTSDRDLFGARPTTELLPAAISAVDQASPHVSPRRFKDIEHVLSSKTATGLSAPWPLAPGISGAVSSGSTSSPWESVTSICGSVATIGGPIEAASIDDHNEEET